jgi:peroxiredoxin
MRSVFVDRRINFGRSVAAWLVVIGALFAGPLHLGLAQDEKQGEETEEEVSGIRVRGQLVVENSDLQVDLAGFEMTLEQIVEAPKLPLPENFQSMTIEQRQKWYQDFQASEAGKKYQEELTKTDAARKKFSATTDAEGKFVFEGAFAGNFGLFGQKELVLNEKTYLADFFAEVPIGEGVKFLDLGGMPLEIRRILKVGDAAPDLVLEPKSEAESASIVAIKDMAGKPTLLCFFTADSLARVRTEIDAVAAEKPEQVQVVGVNLDKPSEDLKKQLAELKLSWEVVSTSGLETAPVLVDYGILALPGFCLIDAQGNVLMNDEAFYEALGVQGATMRSVISAAVTGKK